MAIVARWFRLLRGSQRAARTPVKPARPEQPLVMVGSFASAALGAMYADLLQQAGIPVLRQEWGGGSALLGGVPVGVRLLVPRDRLAEARAVLGDEQGDDAEREEERS